MSNSAPNNIDFRVAYYCGDRKTGTLTLIERKGGEQSQKQLPVGGASDLDKALKPVMVGIDEKDRVILFDPQTKALSFSDEFAEDAFPAHIYSDPNSGRDWFMNDGDKETGNDTLNFGDKGSSVMVIDNTSSSKAEYLDIICVGRGHHQANFSYPTDKAPHVPSQAYVSNLKDGTISVIGNDPAKADSYLKVVATINLCEADKEEGMSGPTVPNNAFPHGLTYSGLTGKIYNLNNGYGTVAVIDPVTHEIEQRVALKGCSNLFATPCGRYVIGRGADRKSDAEHVIAKLMLLDLQTLEVVDEVKLQDVYVSKYFFNPEGSKLYLSTSSSGSPEQAANLKSDAVLVFDLTALPKLKLATELRLGSASGTLEFITENGNTQLVLSSNSADGLMIAIDPNSDEVVERQPVVEPVSHSRLWALPRA